MWARIPVVVCAYLIATSPVQERDGPLAQKVDLVRVEKSQRQLQLVGGGQILRSYAIALGGDPAGHKHREGDERTPEGRYVLDWRNPNSVAHESIHISYPNAHDLAAARARGVEPGGLIMIHGQPNGLDRRAASNGRLDRRLYCGYGLRHG